MAWLILQEKGYMFIRYLFSILNRLVSNDYETVMHAGQAIITRAKIPSLYSNYSRYLPGLNIQRELFGYRFESPITFAAFEAHFDSIRFWIELGCGGGCLKTIKPHFSKGNDRPRVNQIKYKGNEHLLNALGLPGPGIHQFLRNLEKEQLAYNVPIGLSIGGNSIEEYESVIQESIPVIGNYLKSPYIELNISCPNTNTGQVLHDSVEDIESLINKIKALNNQLLIVIKVSPDASNRNLCDIGSLARQFDYVTINAGNTQYKTCESLNLPKDSISIGGGGLSGPCLFKRTLEMAALLEQFKLPLIATGGIQHADQIIELQRYGVELVGMATNLVKNPFSIVRINNELSKR